MADVLLRVPLVGQRQISAGRPMLVRNAAGREVDAGSMACWYASAEMVSYYFRIGPRDGLRSVCMEGEGLRVGSIDALASSEGLKRVRPAGVLDRNALVALLRAHGPLWAAGRFLGGNLTGGHVVVLTGVQGAFAYYNDPWEPQNKVRAVSWFLQQLYPFENALLAKDRQRY